MKINVTAHVSHRKGEGKVRILTDVVIRLDGKTAIAHKTLGGRFDSVQALKEFKNRPNAFTPEGGVSADWIKVYAKVA